MIKPIQFDKKTYVLSCIHCGILLSCEEDDIFQFSWQGLPNLGTKLKGKCPRCSTTYGIQDLQDPNKVHQFFSANLIDIVGPIE